MSASLASFFAVDIWALAATALAGAALAAVAVAVPGRAGAARAGAAFAAVARAGTALAAVALAAVALAAPLLNSKRPLLSHHWRRIQIHANFQTCNGKEKTLERKKVCRLQTHPSCLLIFA